MSTKAMPAPTSRIQEIYGFLAGKTILGVRAMTQEEMELFGWDNNSSKDAIIVLLSGGHAIIPSQDPEGNGPGHLFVERTETVVD